MQLKRGKWMVGERVNLLLRAPDIVKELRMLSHFFAAVDDSLHRGHGTGFPQHSETFIAKIVVFQQLLSALAILTEARSPSLEAELLVAHGSR